MEINNQLTLLSFADLKSLDDWTENAIYKEQNSEKKDEEFLKELGEQSVIIIEEINRRRTAIFATPVPSSLKGIKNENFYK